MPKRSSYAQGTPSWVDLQSTDQAGAKAFYGPLFGWTFDDMPLPDGGVYSIALKNGERAAAIAPQPDMLKEQGLPSFWGTYIAVDDVDAAAKRADAAGGTVVVEPLDVMGAGRMAIVTDPSGATLGLWQAGEHIGATIVNEPGALIWNELQTSDEAGALAFYKEVLGINTESMEMDGRPYTLIKVGDDMVGGATAPGMPGVPNHWHVYFSVANVAESMAQAEKLGGTVLAGPFDASIGKMAVIQDPQGAVHSFFEAKGEAS